MVNPNPVASLVDTNKIFNVKHVMTFAVVLLIALTLINLVSYEQVTDDGKIERKFKNFKKQ